MHSSELENTLFWSTLLQICVLSIQERLYRSLKTISSAFRFHNNIYNEFEIHVLRSHSPADNGLSFNYRWFRLFYWNAVSYESNDNTFLLDRNYFNKYSLLWILVWKRTAINVFNMMSEQITPHSIGLWNSKRIQEILAQTRKIFKINDFSGIQLLERLLLSLSVVSYWKTRQSKLFSRSYLFRREKSSSLMK